MSYVEFLRITPKVEHVDPDKFRGLDIRSKTSILTDIFPDDADKGVVEYLLSLFDEVRTLYIAYKP